MAKTKRETQTGHILGHLRTYGSITSMEAFELYGATRLSAIIFELRKKYNISTEMRECKNRYGGTCQYGVYKLEGEL